MQELTLPAPPAWQHGWFKAKSGQISFSQRLHAPSIPEPNFVHWLVLQHTQLPVGGINVAPDIDVNLCGCVPKS
jgi:hypothetical protein